MKAITTKFVGATNHKPARIIASDMDGNRITLSADYEDAHRRTAVALCEKMHWTGSDTLIEGSIKGGRVFVFPTTVARNDLHRDLQKTTGAAIAEWSAKTPIDVAKAQYAAATVPKHCTKCGTHVAHTADWTLYPWPDGAELCSSCNDARHEVDDYTDVENAVNQKARGVR